MYTKHRTRLALASTLGVVLALATTTALASAMGFDEDDEAGIKSTACAGIGCQDGGRECAKVSGTLKAGIPPWSGEVSVTYTCYEAPAK